MFLPQIKGALLDEIRRAIEELRALGSLLRYGCSWDEGTEKPTRDTSLLDIFLQRE